MHLSTRTGAVLEIDLAGIVANWRLLARLVQPASCAAVVKADGYGCGAVPVASALAAAGCRLFFTATLDEGLALRSALPEPVAIAVLNGVPPGGAAEFVEHRLLPVLNAICVWPLYLENLKRERRVEAFQEVLFWALALTFAVIFMPIPSPAGLSSKPVCSCTSDSTKPACRFAWAPMAAA